MHHTGSDNDDEARVDAFLKALAGVKPIYRVQIGNICEVFYLPDGRRLVGNSGRCT